MREQVNAEALLRSDELKTALLRAVSHDLRSPLQAIAAASGGLHFAALDDDEQELLDTIGAESGQDEPHDREPARPVAPERGRAPPGRPTGSTRGSSSRRLSPSSSAASRRPDPRRGRPRRAPGARRRPAAPARRRERRRERAQVLGRRPGRRRQHRPARRRSSRSRCTITDPASRPRTPSGSSSRSPAAAGQRDVPGSGLGLAIARGLAVANGGALRLSAATDGGGSTFVLELPAARAEAEA